mmetsp:Transcript_7393/g.24099  ORF Transcript_7393/g.24099 Transcript_7393/m.24099 type:complete len:200 (-) Transcript_7393:1312-1911(-)
MASKPHCRSLSAASWRASESSAESSTASAECDSSSSADEWCGTSARRTAWALLTTTAAASCGDQCDRRVCGGSVSAAGVPTKSAALDAFLNARVAADAHRHRSSAARTAPKTARSMASRAVSPAPSLMAASASRSEPTSVAASPTSVHVGSRSWNLAGIATSTAETKRWTASLRRAAAFAAHSATCLDKLSLGFRNVSV